MTLLRFSLAAGLFVLLLAPAAPLAARAGSDLDRLSSVPSWASGSRAAAPDAAGDDAFVVPPVPGGGTAPNPVPVDVGLVGLAAAGAAYAARRLRARR